MKRVLAVWLFALVAASTAHAQHEGMPRTAFVFESRLGGAFALTGFGGSAIIIPGLTVGARLLDRVHLGLDFFITNATGIGPGQGAATVFTLGPLVAIDILKDQLNRVAFYGKFALGFGAVVQSGGGAPSNDTFVFRYDLGLGVRFAPVRHFAIGMESGVLGLSNNPGANGTGVNQTGVLVTGLYGSLVGTFFYGH